MKHETEVEKQQQEIEHNPAQGIRKVVYDCFDHRIVNETNPDVPLYMIINQHGFVGYITEEPTGEFRGFLNEATMLAFNVGAGYVSAITFDDCIKNLTDAHVAKFHDVWVEHRKEGKA